MTATQVTTVTGRTDTDTALTGNGGAHTHFVDTFRFDGLYPGFINQSTGRYNDVAFRTWLVYVGRNYTTQNTITQCHNHVAAFDQRSHDQAVFRATIVLGNHQILRHVNQTTGQVTGVSGFQCGIRQTFTSTVSRGEVLQYVQTFTEVRYDRRFDDRAIRLRHQTTHTRQLTNLRRATTSTGVSHHVNRVERFLIHFVTVAIDHFLFTQVVHHRLRYQFVSARPDVDNLVVFLAVSHQTGSKLALDLFYFSVGIGNDFRFLIRNNEIVYTDRRTGTGGILEAGIHHLVSENDGVLQTYTAVCSVDHVGDRFLLHRTVDQLKRQTFRHNAEQQSTTNRGINHFALNMLSTIIVI